MRPCASDWLPVLDDACGHVSAAQVNSNEVRVDDGYARHGGERQLVAFTRRQWIGTQTTAVSYPACRPQGG